MAREAELSAISEIYSIMRFKTGQNWPLSGMCFKVVKHSHDWLFCSFLCVLEEFVSLVPVAVVFVLGKIGTCSFANIDELQVSVFYRIHDQIIVYISWAQFSLRATWRSKGIKAESFWSQVPMKRFVHGSNHINHMHVIGVYARCKTYTSS